MQYTNSMITFKMAYTGTTGEQRLKALLGFGKTLGRYSAEEGLTIGRTESGVECSKSGRCVVKIGYDLEAGPLTNVHEIIVDCTDEARIASELKGFYMSNHFSEPN